MTLRALPLALLLVAVASGCDAIGGSDPVVLTGTVVNEDTNRPLVGATVQITTMDVEEVSDSTGTYSATFAADSTVTVQIVAFKTGYASDTRIVTVEPGQALTVPALALRPSEAGEGTSGPAASITLSPRSSSSVGVTGTGAVETGQLVFVALDADNKPVDAAHAVDISVAIIQGPGGGEFLSPAAPATRRTDENGEARVTLTSGTKAGVVQVETRATVEGRVLRSQPITLVIHGGFPDQAHFTLIPSKRNFAGAARFGITNEIGSLLGDRYGNPVRVGTQVYYTTDGGVIGGSSATDVGGRGSVVLTAANPLPPGDYATLRARTSGADGVAIETTVRVLFSGVPRIVLLTAGQELGTYRYRVSDPRNFPLAEGTAITVTVEGANVETRGNIGETLEDEIEPGSGRTDFQFTVRKTDPALPAAIDLIRIDVVGPNGTATGQRPGNLRPGVSVAGRAPETAESR